MQILAAAREMAQKAFKERLQEIEMSEYDAEMYERFSGNVRRQVTSLRVILESLQVGGWQGWFKNLLFLGIWLKCPSKMYFFQVKDINIHPSQW